MFISHKDRIIFFHNPKAAGNSVSGFFRVAHRILRPATHSQEEYIWPYVSFTKRHVTPAEYKDLMWDDYGQEIWHGYFKFAIVRNPWDRMVSLYHWNAQISPHRESFTFNSFEEWLHSTHRGFRSKNGDFNVVPQHHWTHIGGELAVNSVLRLENIQEEIEEVKRWMHPSSNPPDFPFRNASKHEAWQTYYTAELIEIVAEICAEDIELFGYKSS
jgi:hypothetical protein